MDELKEELAVLGIGEDQIDGVNRNRSGIRKSKASGRNGRSVQFSDEG